MNVWVKAQTDHVVHLSVYPQSGAAHFAVFSGSASIDQGVAIVQALLCEGLARSFHDAGHHVEIKVLGLSKMANTTEVGLIKAMSGPLVP